MRPYLGEPARERVARRRSSLIDAAFARLGDDRWRDTSISALCADANLNKRYFYESFPDLDAVEQTVISKLAEELSATGVEAASAALRHGLDTDELAHDVLGHCIDWLVDDPRRTRVLFSVTSENPGAFAARNAALEQMAGLLSTFGVAYHGDRNPTVEVTPAQGARASLSASILIGGTIEAVRRWIDGRVELPYDAFVAEIAHTWVTVAQSAVARAREA